MLSRAALALLLAITLITAAQCAVLCAMPAPPVKCHHHQPAKSAHCATAMLPSASQPQIMLDVAAPPPSPLTIVTLATQPPLTTEPVATPSPHDDPPLTLRI